MAKIIDGKAIAKDIHREIADEVRSLSEKYGKVRFGFVWFDAMWVVGLTGIGDIFRCRGSRW